MFGVSRSTEQIEEQVGIGRTRRQSTLSLLTCCISRRLGALQSRHCGEDSEVAKKIAMDPDRHRLCPVCSDVAPEGTAEGRHDRVAPFDLVESFQATSTTSTTEGSAVTAVGPFSGGPTNAEPAQKSTSARKVRRLRRISRTALP
jgi:hypothetical protein